MLNTLHGCKKALWISGLFVLVFATESAVAAGLTVGNMASSITGSFVDLTKLITAGS